MSAVPAQRRLPELLAPAGDEECLRAAVANGADAVYFGLDDFNARRRAENFSLARLPELVQWLHRRNVRAYVAFNTLIFPLELDRAQAYVAGMAAAGVDAIIVQDLGLMRLARAMCPTLPIHASTQTTQTHPAGVAVLKSLGVSRVILARELSVEQIAAVARATDIELEVFVHGAICISFSGQCLASEVMWGRSANRGMCAQACRLPYELIGEGQGRGQDDRPYPLSPRDLCAAGLLEQLTALGVAGLKIEGRLKSAAYVASATRIYREVLDNVAHGRGSRLTREQELELTLSFSRGFTTGFLGGAKPKELVDGRFPRSRGLLIGKVVRRTQRGLAVNLGADGRAGECPLSPGDGVVFDDGREETAEQGGRIYEVHPGTGRAVELVFGREDVDLNAVSIGSDVWKTDDPALRRRLERSGRKEDAVRRAPLWVRVEAAVGERLRLTLRDDAGREIAVESQQALEQATRHPLTVELLREQLGRLGDSPFELAGVELIGPQGPVPSVPAMAPKSLLNELRRQGVEKLLEVRDAAGRYAVARPGALGEMLAELASLPVGDFRRSVAAGLRTGRFGEGACATEKLETALGRGAEGSPEEGGRDARPPIGDARLPVGDARLAMSGGVCPPKCGQVYSPMAVLVRTRAQLEATLAWAETASARPALVYVDTDPAEYESALQTLRTAGTLAGLVTPMVILPGEERLLDAIVAAAPGVVLARNLAAAAYLRERAPDLRLVADHALNAANELTMAVLVESGFVRVTPAYDLSASQSTSMRSRAPSIAAELIVHAHVPMFYTAHRLTSGPVDGVDLRQRDGYCDPVWLDPAGRTTVFSAAVQSALGEWATVMNPCPACIRVELLRESAEQTRTVLDTYTEVLDKTLPPAEALRRLLRVYPDGVTAGTLAEALPTDMPNRR